MSIFRQGPPPKGTRWYLYKHHLGDYMHRWIFLTPWGTLRIHHILRSDEDRHMHDHPFDFTSFLLKGSYTEVTKDSVHPLSGDRYKLWPRFSLIKKVAEDAHRLILSDSVWTFVVGGPKRRAWGFWTETGWINHWDYENVLTEQRKLKELPKQENDHESERQQSRV